MTGLAPSLPATPLRASCPAPSLVERTWTGRAMGGGLALRVAAPPADAGRADAALVVTAARIGAWAARLTRYTETSDLARLNADPAAAAVTVRPTLAAVLRWAATAAPETDGLLDVTLLDARLAAEHGDETPVRPAAWSLVDGPRGTGRVLRSAPCRFDLDGVAKGAIADRALALLRRWPAALVDADGDIALRTGRGRTWEIAVADPRDPAADLGVLALDDRIPGGSHGIATSGTSIHRWPDGAGGAPRHHLIDPRTGRPARTDLVQVTVLAGSARRAEVLAKSALIAGMDAGLALLDAADVRAALLLRTDGDVVATPGSLAWLA